MANPYTYSRVPNNAHPAVRVLFQQINARNISQGTVMAQSGLSRRAIHSWSSGSSPSVDNLEAALNVLGYRLVAVPIGAETGDPVDA